MKHPDEGTLPDSKGKVIDKAGIESRGYHDKKRTPNRLSVTPTSLSGEVLNRLPPGTDIEDQHVSAAAETAGRLKRTKEVDEMGYPGDGWERGE